MSIIKPIEPRHQGQSWGDWFFTDPTTGRKVVAQAPNVPLFVFFGCRIGAWLIPNDTVSSVLSIASSLALLWWAGWELLAGDAPWRRVLGLIVGLYALFAFVTG